MKLQRLLMVALLAALGLAGWAASHPTDGQAIPESRKATPRQSPPDDIVLVVGHAPASVSARAPHPWPPSDPRHAGAPANVAADLPFSVMNASSEGPPANGVVRLPPLPAPTGLGDS